MEEKIKALIADNLGINNEIDMDVNFVDDLGADSLDVVELTMLIEEEFNIEIPDSMVMTTPRDYYRLVYTKVNLM